MIEYLIIDGNNLLHRSYRANMELKTKTGLYSGMFYGTFRTLMSLKRKYRSFKLLWVWDGRAKEKYEIQPDYKADRSRIPSDIWSQTTDIKEGLKSINITQYYNPDQEADDIIATLTEQSIREDETNKVYIYTNDRDMLQLVQNGKVTVYRPKVANSPEKFYDEEAVEKEYGVRPEKLASFRSLDGDKSDNIKGVPRIPRKLLASALNKYGSIEEMYKNLDDIKLTDFQFRNLKESYQRILNNFRIIRLNRTINNMKITLGEPNKEKIESLLEKYNIKTIKSDDILDLFLSTLNKKFTDARPAYELESYSLFD